jgi:hypothetical protein
LLEVIRSIPRHKMNHNAILAQFRAGKKVERQPAYAELVGVDNALFVWLNHSLQSAAPWLNCVLRPLNANETRIVHPGISGHCVFNADNGSFHAELPLGDPPITFVHWIDQGSIGAAAMNFCINSLMYFMLVMPDPNHRVWNDIKLAAQKAQRYWWRTFVQMTLVYNLAYGPFGKGHWFDEKSTYFNQWKAEYTAQSPAFQKYAASIAKDLGKEEPETADDFEALFQAVLVMDNFKNKGPLVKLMRCTTEKL